MTTRIRDQQLLSYVAGRVWATDEATKSLLVSIITRHYLGVRLTSGELAEISHAGRARPAAQQGGQIAVLPLWGPLVPHAGMMVDLSTPGTGLDEWQQMFKAAVADPNVSTILLHVNSPGGSAEGVTETAKVIRDGRAQKRVVAVADGMAASAAFAIASQADELYVTPSGMVGAVHCYTVHQDISKALEMEGIKPTLIGEPDDGAAEAMSFLELSGENRAHLQSMVRQFYDMFVADVGKGRGVDASTVEESFGRGRVLTARDALSAGMVDGISSFDDTLAALRAGKQVGRGARQQARDLTQAVASATAPLTAGAGVVEVVTDVLSRAGAGATAHIVFDPPSSAVERAAAPTKAAAGGTTTGGSMSTVNTDGRQHTIEEWAAQQTHLESEMDDLTAQAAGRAFTDDEQARFDQLEAEHLEIGSTITNIQDRESRRAKLAGDKTKQVSGDGAAVAWEGRSNVGRGGPQDIFDLSAYRSHARSVDDLAPLWRDGALRANETAAYMTEEVGRTRAFVERLLRQDGSTNTRDSFAHRMLVTANPAYDAAFGRWLMGRETAADTNMIRMAVTNTGLGSDTPVPVTIDPTVLYTGLGARSPLRELARVVTITGLTWRGIGSDGVSLSYGAEDAAINPATPDFDAPDVSVIPARGEIQFSVDVEGDWPSLRSELQLMFQQAKFRLEADKFLNGTGTAEPEGLIWKLDDDGSTIDDTATADTLTLDDVIATSDNLPSAFDFNAQWLAHKAFYSNVAALAAAAGRIDVWVPLAQGFNQQSGNTGHSLLNSGAYTASEISKLFTTGGEEVAVIGDFSQGFVIVDRVGLNVELDPHPRDTNGKWTGNRGLVCWFRNNTKVRTVNAFRLLRIKHS